MLILTRREGESVIIDRQTRVTIRAIEGGRVVLGVEAQKEVALVREELISDFSDARDSASAS